MGSACGDSLSARPVEAFAAARLDTLGIHCRIRRVRRITQRPGRLRIDEIEETVAWREATESDRLTDAAFLGVSYESPSDTADARGVWPLAVVLAVLEESVTHPDSLSRDIFVTLGAVRDWDILDVSPPDRTASVVLDSAYSSVLEASGSAGPSPPLARLRQPGILMGLTPKSDLPVMARDPRSRMLADGSVRARRLEHPSSVSVTASGDMLAIKLAEGVAADDRAALYDLTDFVGRALRNTDGWPTRQPSQLQWNWTTIEWLLGILLPMLFIAVGTWALLAESVTNLRNAKRALRHVYAEVVSHLLWYRPAADRLDRRIAHMTSRHKRAEDRVKRLLAADSPAREAARLRKAARATRCSEELGQGLERLKAERDAAQSEANSAKEALWRFANDPEHVREWDSGASDGAVGAAGSPHANASGERDPDDAIGWLTRSTRLRRMWLIWASPFLELGGTPRMWQPRDRPVQFVSRMKVLSSRLLYWRAYHEKVLETSKVDAREIVGGVWTGVWGSITSREGVVAFCAGIVSVIAAVALSVSGLLPLVIEKVSVPEPTVAFRTALKLALQAGLVVGVYLAFSGRGHGRPMVWGAAALTMLGLTTIEFTALEGALSDAFDSQRVTLMQLVIVAMLFMGEAFDNRAKCSGKRGAEQEETVEREKQGAEADRDRCLKGTADEPRRGFAERVKQAGARFARYEKRERFLVFGVILLYTVIFLHFFYPAMRWDVASPSARGVRGDAHEIVVVAGTVVLLPVFSLWSAWRAAAKCREEKQSAATKAAEHG